MPAKTHFAHDEATLTVCGRTVDSVELAPFGEFDCATCERAAS